jgi:hypothetical protein
MWAADLALHLDHGRRGPWLRGCRTLPVTRACGTAYFTYVQSIRHQVASPCTAANIRTITRSTVTYILKLPCQPVVGKVAAWLLLGSGVLGFVAAETFLTADAYFAFGAFASRWWLALWLAFLIVAQGWLTGTWAIRAVSAFRNHAGTASFGRLAALCFGIGLLEVTLAPFIFALTMILLAP